MANNFATQSFEKINKSTGGVAGNVVAGLKDATESATKDVVAGVVKAPIDMLKDLFGMDTSDSGVEDPGIGGSGPQGQTQNSGNAPSPDFAKKVAREREKRQLLLNQHRLVLAEFEERHNKTQRKEKDEKQEEQQQKQQKRVEIRQLQQKRRQEAAWKQTLKGRTGSKEGAKKVT